MDAELKERAAFYLAGKRTGARPAQAEQVGLRPALFAAYRDLSALRYDFPLVLREDSGEGFAEPLSELIDRALDNTGLSGDDAERLRMHALRLERELRSMLSRGAGGSLPALLDEAARQVTSGADTGLIADSLRRLKGVPELAGELVDCDSALPVRLMTHAWQSVQKKKAAAFRRNIERLILKLNEILAADLARSGAGRTPSSLRASVEGSFADAFDFDQMSRLLQRVSADTSLSDARRQRIESTIDVLRSQLFFAAPGRDEHFRFQFDSCKRAAGAFRMRQPAMAELMRAITAAELEIEGELGGPRHEVLMRQLGANSLDARELARFPDYLVCINARDLHAAEIDELTDLLSRGLPMKVLVQTDDLLSEPPEGAGTPAIGGRSRQLANMAIGLNEVFVLQSASSNLARCRDRILKAMNFFGPALISVYSGVGSGAETGSSASERGESPYLSAAAAMESRAFPAVSYDPSAGRDWGSRFTLDDNPQPARDWPVHELVYEDAEHQRVEEQVAFTLIDFIASDRRYARHFAVVPPEQNKNLVTSVEDCVDHEARILPTEFPGLWMVDRNNTLQRVIVDESLMRETRRCREAWRSLQELGRLGKAAPTAAAATTSASAESPATPEAASAGAAPSTSASAGPSAAPAVEPSTEADGAHAPGDPYIETVRCSSCNECIQLNGKMFAYDANQQARIVDPDAGTFRQLVEAAESCQVAVIHPGKPRNPNEPGLEELLKRAEAFN